MSRLSPFCRAAAFFAAAFFFFAGCGFADGLSADVSSRNVITGDPFRVIVEWSGAAAPSQGPAFEHPEAAVLSSPQQNSSFYSVNGRVSQSLSWSWLVQTDAPGIIDFGTVRIVAGGKTFEARVPPVSVGPPPPQPFVRVRLSSDKPQVLVDESFSVEVDVEVALPDAPEGAGPFSPLDPARPPLLRSAHLESGAQFESCRFELDPWKVLERCAVRQGGAGFRVNSYVSREDPFDSLRFGGFGSIHSTFSSPFGDSRPFVFDLPHEIFGENGTNFVRYSLSIPFRATSEGLCHFPPARFEGDVIRSFNEQGRPVSVSRQIVAVSEAFDLRVVPPPREGRPESFFGALGTSLSPEVSLDAQTCRQGDPLSLALRLEGDLVPSTVGEPDIFTQPEMKANFRAWGSVERKDDGSVPVFIYKIRPVTAGTIEIPAIELAYFDTAERVYKTVETDPVPLRVDHVADFDPSALFAAATTNEAFQALSTGVSGPVAPSLSLDPSEPSSHRPLSAAVFAIAVLLPPALWLFAILGPGLIRFGRKSVFSLLRSILRTRAESAIRTAETPQEVLAWLRQRLRDRWGESVDGLTPADLNDLFVKRGVDDEKRKKAVALVQEVFDEAFRPGADVRAVVRSRRADIASAVLAAIRSAPIVALLLAAGTVFAGPDADFYWRSAGAKACAAYSPVEFLEAAREYRALVDAAEAPSAPLFMNLGATLLQAGCGDEAVDAFRRVEAVAGSSLWTKSGIECGGGRENEFLRTVLAFHFRLPLKVRQVIFIGAWTLFWFSLVAVRFGRHYGSIRRAAAVVAVFFAVVAAVSGASVAASERLLRSPVPALPDAPPQEERGEN